MGSLWEPPWAPTAAGAWHFIGLCVNRFPTLHQDYSRGCLRPGDKAPDLGLN